MVQTRRAAPRTGVAFTALAVLLFVLAVGAALYYEFGGPIPVGPFALIGDDSIGQGIVATLSGSRSPAVLMQNHGVFTIGPSGKAAVKAAVMTEDVARTVHFARQLGELIPIAQADIDVDDSTREALASHIEQGGGREDVADVLRTGPS